MILDLRSVGVPTSIFTWLIQSHSQSVIREVHKILADPFLCIYCTQYEYESLPSGRQYRLPVCLYSRFKKSIMHHSNKMLFYSCNGKHRDLYIYRECIMYYALLYLLFLDPMSKTNFSLGMIKCISFYSLNVYSVLNDRKC